MTNIKIAILASGSGSNAENIANYFKANPTVSIDLILSNKPDAFVLERSKKLGITSGVFNKSDLNNGIVTDKLKAKRIDFIVLAGFLLKIPAALIDAFQGRIINIHPALLPKYGGKGMYGHHVHNAVIANKEKESGITIHLVNEIYDDGKILRQEKCQISAEENPDSLAQKVHELEYLYFPKTIEDYILQKDS